MKEQDVSRLLRQDALDTPLPASLQRAALDAAYGKEKPIMKKKISVSLIFAVCLLFLCSVALAVANQAGIMDFVGRYADSFVPENAGEYVQQCDLVMENEVFTATLREQYYDGRSVRIVMDFAPRNKNVLFIGADSWGDDPWQGLISLDHSNQAPEDQRCISDVLPEYAAVYACGFISVPDEEDRTLGGTGDYVLNPETGALTVYDQLEFAESKENRQIAIRASAFPVSLQEGEMIMDTENGIRAEMTLPLAAAAATESYESIAPVEFPSVGVRVDRMLLEVKPQEIYVTLDCSIIDEAAYASQENGVWMEFVDPNSQETEAYRQLLPSGLTGGASSSIVIDGKYQQFETLGRNALYDTYTLRACNRWSQERFETQEITLKPVE